MLLNLGDFSNRGRYADLEREKFWQLFSEANV